MKEIIINHSRTIGINQGCPEETRIYDHQRIGGEKECQESKEVNKAVNEKCKEGKNEMADQYPGVC